MAQSTSSSIVIVLRYKSCTVPKAYRTFFFCRRPFQPHAEVPCPVPLLRAGDDPAALRCIACLQGSVRWYLVFWLVDPVGTRTAGAIDSGPVTKFPKFFGPGLAADLPLVKGDLHPISTTTSARQTISFPLHWPLSHVSLQPRSPFLFHTVCLRHSTCVE